MKAQLIVYNDCSMIFSSRFFNPFGYGAMFKADTDYEVVNEFSRKVKLLQDEHNYGDILTEVIRRNFQECQYNSDERETRFTAESVKVSNVKGLWIILAACIGLAFIFHVGKLLYFHFRNKENFYFHGPFASNDKNISELAQKILSEQIKRVEGQIAAEIRDFEKYLIQVKAKHHLNFKKQKLKRVFAPNSSFETSSLDLSKQGTKLMGDNSTPNSGRPLQAPTSRLSSNRNELAGVVSKNSNIRRDQSLRQQEIQLRENV
jgi:hypothetical protein